jgi:hypothetical protein
MKEAIGILIILLAAGCTAPVSPEQLRSGSRFHSRYTSEMEYGRVYQLLLEDALPRLVTTFSALQLNRATYPESRRAAIWRDYLESDSIRATAWLVDIQAVPGGSTVDVYGLNERHWLRIDRAVQKLPGLVKEE